jgi:hypothetical protein
MTAASGEGETDRLYAELQAAGVDVIVDDRGLRPGAMFADWELVGVPHRVVIGERGLKEGKLEYQGRRDTEATPSRWPTWSPSSKANWASDVDTFIGRACALARARAARRLLLSSGAAQAGNQKEEALADSVRLALEHAIRDGRPPKPAFRDELARARYQQWFDAMSARLKRRCRTSSRAPSSSRWPGTKRPAPASIRDWCWA